jgi:hypothetical protein
MEMSGRETPLHLRGKEGGKVSEKRRWARPIGQEYREGIRIYEGKAPKE